MKIEGIIFDFDGTLLDSMSIWETLGSDFLIKRNITPEPELNEKLKTMSLNQVAQFYQDCYGLSETVDEIIHEVNLMIENYYADGLNLKEGVLELLENFHASGVKMCIATATDRFMVESALKRHQIAHYFSDIVTCGEVGASKKHPMIFEVALEKLNTKKENTLVIEDSLHAIETARKAGFQVVGVYDDFSKNEQLMIKKCANYYLTSLKDWQISLI